jgi:hypothetical protein
MTDRRSFLTTVTSSLAGVLVPALAPRALHGALAVTAEPTLFWANPAGRANLVRFFISGTAAPAGRLRLYDRSRRLIGTAGLLRVGDVLRGELWIDLDRPMTVTSELEAPGLGRVLRTPHRLVPPQRWTIVWLTAGDADEIRDRLDRLPPINRLVQQAIWREAGVIANPLAGADRLHTLDHVAFLQAGGDGAGSLAESLGLPLGSVALTDTLEALPASTPLALEGAGVPYLVRRFGDDPFAWWQGPDGSRVLTVTLPAEADPTALGFGAAGDEMANRIEAHLHAVAWTRVQQREGESDAVTFVVETQVTDRLPGMVAAVREWNRRYAHPNIVIGGAEDLERVAAHVPATIPTVPSAPGTVAGTAPDAATLLRLAAEREQAGRCRLREVLAPLATLMTEPAAGSDAAQRIAAGIDTRAPGYLVINPSPMRRTDTIVLPDGRLQLVTDVPALGYAFVLDEGVAADTAPIAVGDGPPTIEGLALSAQIDTASGAIRSLRYRDHWRQWAAGRGLNAADTAIMLRGERQAFSGVGTRLVVQRHSAYHGTFSSTIAMYDALPWIDIENRADAPERPSLAYGFDFALEDSTVRWEIPAGHAESIPPLNRLVHLRWLAVDGPSASLLFRGAQTPYVAVAAGTRLDTPAAAGVARYRLHLTPETPSIAECASFGWSTEPLEVVPVSGDGEGHLPRFGTPVVLDQADAAVVGIEATADAGQAVVYIQNMAPDARLLTLGFGLLAWTEARRVDFRGREIPETVTPVPDGLAVEALPWGVVAVRLEGLRLRSGG